MNILILGSGGREHALAWKIAQSEECEKIFVSPGNAGTLQIAKNVEADISSFDSVVSIIKTHSIDMLVVGPEAPLVGGLVDYLKKIPAMKDLSIIGPARKGAQLEGSKDFAKEFMARNQIPTAAYRTFTKSEFDEASAYLATLSPPYVLKADGLAAGKGVIISSSIDDAREELKEMLLRSKFGDASAKVVIEEFLEGIELSVFALTDGENYVLLPSAKDYKRIGEGDTGLNTGGMGAVSPVPFVDEAFMDHIEKDIIQPTISGLKKEQIPYVGFLFFGLIKVGSKAFVIEYNVRLGDPETEAILPRISSDFLGLLKAAAAKQLHTATLKVSPSAACTVVLVSEGYPQSYQKGKVVQGLSDVGSVLTFHSGTNHVDTEVITDGGRVLALTALDKDPDSARRQCYKAAEKVFFEGVFYRKDIGRDML